MALTLPDHDQCRTHRQYKLGCEQYEGLLKRSGQRCEICRKSAAHTSRRKLFIDHEWPQWAVRGLLCNGCNSRLEDGSKNPLWAADYLANTWWKQECARLGIPTTMAPEPDHGSAIRDQYGVLWLREGDGKWRPHGHGKPGISDATWEWLYKQRGPQNMALLDLSAEANEWRIWEAEKAALQGLVTRLGGYLPPLRRVYRSGHFVSPWDEMEGTA